MLEVVEQILVDGDKREENRLEELQNGMKKMLEVVEQILVDGDKREENTAKRLAITDCRFVRKTKSWWFKLMQRSGVQPTISSHKRQARLSSL